VSADADARAMALCRGSVREAERIRWNQYRSIWAYVEGTGCRRRALLAHFGDRSQIRVTGPCCDVCDGPPAPDSPDVSRVPGGPDREQGEGLDEAIVAVVRGARPAVGRTRAVEILRGGRSRVIVEHAYDRLDAYGAFAHLRSADVLGRVDALLAEGTLRSSGGRFPKLRAPADAPLPA
jgi:ATP-dependent DNA helicase RecQ